MNKNILTLIIAGFLTAFAIDISAQDKAGSSGVSKERPRTNTQQKTPVKIIQYIPGKWEIEQVLRGKQDVTDTDTLAKNQVIEFNREGRYMSYSGTAMLDSGAYRLNEDHGILYLANAAGDKPSEWNVWFAKDGTMTMMPRLRVKHGEEITYIYRRLPTATSSNRD